MQLIHLTGDLFSAPRNITLAHCISFDARMNQGIAKTFQKYYNIKPEVLATDRQIGAIVPVWRGRFIVQLITKFRCFEKPTITNLANALIVLKNFMFHHNLTEVAVPELAAGLDKIDLNVVISLIHDIFWHTPVTVYMYHLPASRRLQ